MRITFEGSELELISDKAIYFPNERALVIADVHIGKATDLQRVGIRVPLEVSKTNETRLARLLHQYQSDTCYFLGDLFHARKNPEFESIKRLVQKFPETTFVLIKGNHEILKDEDYLKLGLEICESVLINRITLRHHPHWDEDAPSISGHIHPKIRLSGAGKQGIGAAVFIIQKQCMVLPAFGALTGGYRVDPNDFDAVYIPGDGEVFQLK